MESSFSHVMDLLPDAIVWFDKEANLVEVNETAARMWGYDKEELRGMTIFDINPNMHPDTWEAHWNEKVVQSKIFESSHRRANGETFPVEIMDHLVDIDNQQLSCAIVRDITDRKRKEAALRGALMEIRELKEKLEAEKQLFTGRDSIGE